MLKGVKKSLRDESKKESEQSGHMVHTVDAYR